ncbi:MAG TPA: sigma-70 family RNA polymerase sigma factor [Bacillota bacterium]|nr:sigma-70 family RNA polymerase sigma factor [Bacillota bacterium]HOK64615.1 sigma-70 family RNA polymerase sigma factor [Bacillota bacterium]HOL12132.1 sigma-70 family RNA polymerase sigma factor [Bacillota bacterium]HOQ03246.1 sigma-70 family RNA polymerase sigma factor [Bacillota bacterium]HPP60953.1 sigma-70 family RNA polymerase sigma factor [Bacillota bacterium]
MEKVKKGDDEAFADLVEKYNRNIYSLAYRLTGNREDAMDITQEVFLRVFRGISSFDTSKPFLPWANRITYNLCADRGRKLGRSLVEQSLDGSEYLKATVSSSEPTPADAYEDEELSEIVQDAVNQLQDGYRELVIMFHLEGYSIKEIAEITGLKETVIKNRLYRGRKALKEILLNEGFIW